MAKRKQNKSFASNRASAANELRKKQERQQMALSGVIMAVLTILVVGGLSYWSNLSTEAEPAAVSGSSESIASSGAAPIDSDRPLAALEPAERADYYSAPPEMTLDTSKAYEAVIVTENGEMTIKLFDDEAPITVNNFIFLANQGYYDNTTFHRVIPNFMAQAGDPLGAGFGGPGYSFGDEFDPSLRFDRPGLLAMANSGPATNGSQFFITHGPTTHLNDLHTIFGELIDGKDVLDQVRIRDPQSDPAPGDLIIRIDIYEK